MGAWWSCALQFCARIRAIEWVIWGGAVALTLGLLILMWTRWGKTRLTHKCLALSLFTHLLLFIWFLSKEMIVGAPGPLGREGAPGQVGDHPTLLVNNVQVGGDPEAKEPPSGGAAKPWHTTPLRAVPPPPPPGPDRTMVDLTAPPQRSLSETPSFDARPAEAEPLSPRSPQIPSRSEAAPADHLAPAETQETVRAPQPIAQGPVRMSPSPPGELPRERLPSDVPQLARRMPETSNSLLPSPSRGGFADEPKPLSAVDRSLAAKAQAPIIADAGAPAASGVATEEPDTTPRARPADSSRPAADGPTGLLTEAHRQQSRPLSDPVLTSTVDSNAPRRQIGRAHV